MSCKNNLPLVSVDHPDGAEGALVGDLARHRLRALDPESKAAATIFMHPELNAAALQSIQTNLLFATSKGMLKQEASVPAARPMQNLRMNSSTGSDTGGKDSYFVPVYA